MRITRNGRGCRVSASEVVAVNPVGGPTWPTRRRHERIKLVLVHDEVDTFFARQAMVFLERIAIGLIGQWSFRLGLDEKVLAKVRHLAIAVLVVEINQLLQRFRWSMRTERCQVTV